MVTSVVAAATASPTIVVLFHIFRMCRTPSRCSACRMSAATAGDRGPGPGAVGLQGDAERVAAAVGLGHHLLRRGPRGTGVPGAEDLLRGRHVHRDGPVAGSGDR